MSPVISRLIVAFVLASCSGGAASAMGSVQPATAELAHQLDEYRRSLLTYFKAFDLLPIVIPSGQQPGDVFDVKQKGIKVSGAQECFPDLVIPAAASSALPATFQISSDKADLALGVRSLFSLGLGAKFDRDVTVQYTDVKTTTVSQQALKAAVSAKCPDVSRIVSEDKVAVDAATPPRVLAIVGMIVTAKRRIFVGASGDADLDASVAKLATVFGGAGVGAALKAVGLDPSASASLGFGARRGVMVQSDEELPVAFLPAFLPEAVFAMHSLGSETGPTALKWSPLVPSDPLARSYLGKLIDADLAKP